jgi:hypothetical protein
MSKDHLNQDIINRAITDPDSLENGEKEHLQNCQECQGLLKEWQNFIAENKENLSPSQAHLNSLISEVEEKLAAKPAWFVQNQFTLASIGAVCLVLLVILPLLKPGQNNNINHINSLITDPTPEISEYIYSRQDFEEEPLLTDLVNAILPDFVEDEPESFIICQNENFNQGYDNDLDSISSFINPLAGDSL